MRLPDSDRPGGLRSNTVKYRSRSLDVGSHYRSTRLTESSRTRISSGTTWEERVGYSRAIRVGNSVFVSGTTATTREGGFVGEGDPYAQTTQILENISWALGQAGSSLAEVVRYRVYLTRHEDWPDVGRALSEAFGDIRPVNTLIGIAWLVDPRMLVEIEVDAIVGSTDDGIA